MTQKEKEIIEEMLVLINRIKGSTDDIDTDERIPQLELDAIVAKIEKLYELSVALKYFHAHLDEILFENQQQNIREEDIESITKEPTAEKKEVQTEVPIIEQNIEEEIIVETSFEEPALREDEFEEVVEQKMYQAESTKAKEDSIVDKLRLQPVKDLKTVIGINDKFQFINELFKGNTEKYNEVLHVVNNCSSFEEAQQFVSDFNWDQENKVVESFLTLIERRYL